MLVSGGVAEVALWFGGILTGFPCEIDPWLPMDEAEEYKQTVLEQW